MRGRIKVEHKCDEKSLVVLKEDGVLTTYKCLVCGKEFSEIGSIVITADKDLLPKLPEKIITTPLTLLVVPEKPPEICRFLQ